jgi:hypothetical protein
MQTKKALTPIDVNALVARGIHHLAKREDIGATILRKAADHDFKKTLDLVEQSKSKDAAYVIAHAYFDDKKYRRAEEFTILAMKLRNENSAPRLLERIDEARALMDAEKEGDAAEAQKRAWDLHEELLPEEVLDKGLEKFSPIKKRRK